MERPIAHRVELQVAGQAPFRLVRHLDVIEGGEKSAARDLPVQVARLQGDHHRGLLGAVDHRGHAAGAACGPGGPFPSPVLRFRDKRVNVTHVFALLSTGRSAG